MTFDDAIASRELQIAFQVPAERCPHDTPKRLFHLAQPREPGPSQDELLIITAVEAIDAETRVHFEWVFDHDFHSQYDATETWRGVAVLTERGDHLEAWG